MIRKISFFALLILLTIIKSNIYSTEIIDPKLGKMDAESNIVWYDAKLLGIEGKGWLNTESDYDRLPISAKEKVREPLWQLSKNSAGINVRFKTDAQTLNMRWNLTQQNLAMPHMPATGVSGIDLYARDTATGKLMFCKNGRPTGLLNEVSFSIPASSEYVLYLPLYNGVSQLEIGIKKENKLSKFDPIDLSEAIVFYGTSITQGGCVSRPGMNATSIVSRKLNTPVINLGFSGNGWMEMELADLLSELDPAIYVLDCLWNMTSEMVTERIEPFVKRLRNSHPTTPIILVENSSFRNVSTNNGNILRKIFAELKTQGDENLYFLPNTDMLGDDWEGTVDGVHLNDLGMDRQADLFVKFIEPILNKN